MSQTDSYFINKNIFIPEIFVDIYTWMTFDFESIVRSLVVNPFANMFILYLAT